MKKFAIILLQISIVFTTGISAMDWYVRPAGGNYGLENGTNHANAWDGLVNVKWGAGGVQPGDTLWVCGLHVYNMTNAGNMASQADIHVISGTSESSRVIIRGDYPGDPGIVWGAYKISYGTWNYEGNNVWSTTIVGYPYPDWFFEDITADSWVVLDKETTLEGCQKNPGSFYAADFSNGSTLYVHCSDDGNPTGRIYINTYGYDWVLRGGKSYITFMNLKLYNIPDSIWNANDAHHITWIGCTFAYGEHSVLRFYDNCHYMQVISCDLSWAGNGIYNISSTNNAPSYYKYSGNIIHDIGMRVSTQNGDAHGIGIQGGHEGLIEDNYIYNCGSGITLYTFTNQELKNTIVRRNFVRDTHTLGGANSYGIETSCNNDSLSDKSGNIFSQNIVVNANKGFKLQFEDEQKLYNNVAANCGISFYSGRSYNEYGGKVKARNNISLNPTNYHVVFGTSGADSLCDYDFNLYFPDGSGKFSYNSGTYSFSGWQTLARSGYAFDPHSKVAHPLFIDPGNENFQLQSSSPAIDAGVDVGITQDRDGTPIPQGFSPDIGAYEFIFGSNPLMANLTASPTSGNAPLTVNFGASASGGSSPYTFSWNFGDGQTSTAQNPSHTYSTAGNFNATLTVTDSLGTQDSKTASITVRTAPSPLVATASASPTSGQAPLTVNFSGSASGGSSPYSYNWNFGDGGTSGTQNPVHTYSAAGNFTATLTVSDALGSSNSKSVAISVTSATNPLVVSASAIPISGQAPLAVNFTGTAAGGVPLYTYSWAFGDGGTSSVQNPSHTYLAIGGYAATLTVTDSSSSHATSTVNITVGSISSATLSISSETGAPSSGQGGTTDPSPGNHSYPIGSSVLAKSIPNTDFRFSKWGGDVAESSLFNSQASVTMDKSKSIAATFCTKCADVNGDLKITPADAQAAFDIFLGRIANPTWCEKENADVNSSGTKLEPKITPADAQVIFNKYLRRGEISGDCTGNSRSATTTMALGMEIPNATLTVNGFAAKLGEDIYVPILVDSPSEISAFGFDLEFPADKLIFIRLERTALTESFDRVDANVILSEYSDEKVEKKENYSILRVGGYKTDLTFNASSGVLVTLVFRVERDLAGEAPLAVTATYDDIKHASVKNGLIKPKNRQNERERLNKRLGGKRLDF